MDVYTRAFFFKSLKFCSVNALLSPLSVEHYYFPLFGDSTQVLLASFCFTLCSVRLPKANTPARVQRIGVRGGVRAPAGIRRLNNYDFLWLKAMTIVLVSCQQHEAWKCHPSNWMESWWLNCQGPSWNSEPAIPATYSPATIYSIGELNAKYNLQYLVSRLVFWAQSTTRYYIEAGLQ